MAEDKYVLQCVPGTEYHDTVLEQHRVCLHKECDAEHLAGSSVSVCMSRNAKGLRRCLGVSIGCDVATCDRGLVHPRIIFMLQGSSFEKDLSPTSSCNFLY